MGFEEITESNMDPEKHSKSDMVRNIQPKARKTGGGKGVGKKLSDNEGSSQGHDEVIVWRGNKDVSGVPSTSGCSGSQDNWIDSPSPTVKANDLAPPRYVSNKPQRNKDKAPVKNEQRGSGDKGNVAGAPDKVEMRRTGIQHAGSDNNQHKHNGNSGASKAKSGKKHDNEKPKCKGSLDGNVEVSGRKMEKQRDRKGILASQRENTKLPYERLKMQWRAKICPPASSGITDSPNHGRKSFENAKEIGGKRYAVHDILGSGTDGDWEVYLKHAQIQDGASQELGEGDISFSHLNVKFQDSLPPKYVPLMKLQNCKDSETTKDCGTKCYISKQNAHTVLNKHQRNKDGASDKNEQRLGGDIRIGDGALDKNEMRQAWSLGNEDGAPDKGKQIQSSNLWVSKGQTGKSGKKSEMVKTNGKANAKGPLHDTVEMGSGKLEHHDVRKEFEASKQGNENEHKGPLLKGPSTFKGTTGRPNQGTDCFENAKKVGGSEIEEGGICVSYPFPFGNGRPQSIKKGGRKTDAIIITNNGKNPVNLFSVKLSRQRPNNSFGLSDTAGPVQSIQSENNLCLSSVNSLEAKIKSMKISQLDTDSVSFVGGPWLIGPRNQFIIPLLCMTNDIGLHRSSILFEFQDQKITRNATLLAVNDISEQLAPQEPYSKPRKRKSTSFRRIIVGVPPPLPSFGKKLSIYPIPPDLKKFDSKNLPRVLEEGLSMKTYSEYFSTLLHLEELRMQEDMSAYDMHNGTMRSSGEYLVLKVPGLAEKRPSLIYRDKIYVEDPGEKEKGYEGYIHRIEANEIYVKFDKSFHKNFNKELQYHVRFSSSRVNLRRCHQAVAAAEAGTIDENFLFPWDPSARVMHENVSKNDPFNRHLNTEQLSAVHQIKNCYGSPPYLVYGPPGTGKTATLVEAILQILKSNSKSYILACAPSNVASDLLVERLLGPIQKGEIFRLNAFSRPYQDVPPHILPCCSYGESMFYCPPVEDLLEYKIIVSTYLSAAVLDAQGVPQGHFTHIFLDESGQGTEPETMVPIANFAITETTVVLAGDPRQLGPIVSSPICEKVGLGKSYFERLSDLHLYSPDGDDKKFVTKLVRNYRSHPAILELPSRLFYGSELIACAGNGIQKVHWDELPNKKFPVVFVGIEGIDEREGRSPSWFNTIEISKVLEIIIKLRVDKRNSVPGKDIGVITPYHQQVVKLRKAFAANNLSDVKVGSVEQFQGDEKHVIIISTVRSSYQNEEFDMKFNLGFIGNPKRFNVAVTRAKSLLVVVGNPYVLCKDIYWNELLQYCVSHKSYLGCLLPPKDNGDE